jgi:hypothetical protein
MAGFDPVHAPGLGVHRRTEFSGRTLDGGSSSRPLIRSPSINGRYVFVLCRLPCAQEETPKIENEENPVRTSAPVVADRLVELGVLEGQRPPGTLPPAQPVELRKRGRRILGPRAPEGGAQRPQSTLIRPSLAGRA